MIDPGAMRHTVTIEDNQPTRSASGAPVDSWSTWATNVRVKIEPGRSREFLAAKQTQAEVTHEITMRYLPGLKARMRFKLLGATPRYFYFSGIVNVDEAGQWVRLICRETV